MDQDCPSRRSQAPAGPRGGEPWPHPTAARRTHPRRLGVILADDHLIPRQGLAALLRAEPDIGLLGEAADGEAARWLIGSQKPDVAILDLFMPKATGVEVARWVETSRLETRVLLLTMHDDPAMARRATAAGVAGYIHKDNSFEDLITAVRTLADGGTFLGPPRSPAATSPALSAREHEVIRFMAEGKTSKEIARVLGISPRTVDTYRGRLMRKLDVHSVADVVRYAIGRGMIS